MAKSRNSKAISIILSALILTACTSDNYSGRVVDKIVVDKSCYVHTRTSGQSHIFDVECRSQNFVLEIDDGFGMDERCVVSKQVFDETETGSIFSCKIKDD